VKVVTLSSIMLLSSILWFKRGEERPIMKRLGLDNKALTILLYLVMAFLLVIFTRNSVREAALLTGGTLIVPVFEELFFRAYLLDSMVLEKPRQGRALWKKTVFPLVLTSLAFAIVHDDVIAFFVTFPLVNVKFLVVVILRVVFSITMGGLYLLEGRKLIVPTAFHLMFNLSYFLVNS
jgi:membrane protease YdiL (CAAX protease family)